MSRGKEIIAEARRKEDRLTFADWVFMFFVLLIMSSCAIC